MSATPVIPIRVVAETPRRSGYLLTGPRFPILFLAALPAAVVALSSGGDAQRVSALISIGWFSLIPIALRPADSPGHRLLQGRTGEDPRRRTWCHHVSAPRRGGSNSV